MRHDYKKMAHGQDQGKMFLKEWEEPQHSHREKAKEIRDMVVK